MWLIFAFVSAGIVGVRDFFKKQSLCGNDVTAVLCLVAFFSSLLFLPFILASRFTGWLEGSFFHVPPGRPVLHQCSAVKCALLLGCWSCSFAGIKHLPLTVSGIIVAFGPVETVLAAMLVYGERLNGLQGLGVAVSVGSLVGASLSGRKEGLDFRRNRYVWLMLLSTLFSTAAALWDKFAMGSPASGGLGCNVMFVQSWHSIYLTLFMLPLAFATRRRRRAPAGGCGLRFALTVLLVSVCEVAADLLYDAALQLPGAMVGILAMVRRGSVVVSFLLGALVLRERNIRRKACDLLLVFIGMALLFLGSQQKL